MGVENDQIMPMIESSHPLVGLSRLFQVRVERSETGNRHLKHLDGVRAIALLGVLAFHFAPEQLPGGFLGVDMFFVLSGFLMTKHILSRKFSRAFSFKTFLQSRILRICPAMLVTILGTMVASIYVFPKIMIDRICWSAISASSFLSNLKFMTESGYHDTSSISKPLLHTWSLAVEGQFYLLWSLLALICSANNVVNSMLILSSCSLLLNYVEKDRSVMMFFLTPSRLYQFGAGCFALMIYDTGPSSVSSILQITGSTSVVISFLFAHAGEFSVALTSFPIVVGTTFLISTPQGFLSGPKFLSRPSLRYIGKISYSTYLVHWPAISLCSFFVENKLYAKIAAALLTAILSPILYYTIEEEFRVTRQKTRVQTGLLFCILLVFCIFTYAAVTVVGTRFVLQNVSRGGNRRHRGAGLKLPTSKAYQMELESLLLRLRSEKVLIRPGSGKHNYKLIIGDSYARNLLGPIQKSSTTKNGMDPKKKYFFVSSNACMFVTPPRVKMDRAKYVKGCAGATLQAQRMLESKKAEEIVLAARWQDYIDDSKSMLSIESTLRKFGNFSKAITVVGTIPIPRNPKNPLVCLWRNVDDATGTLLKDTFMRCPREFDVDPEDIRMERKLERWLKSSFPNAKYVSPLRSNLCRNMGDSISCSTWNPTKGAYYHDGMGHMSVIGSFEATSGLLL